MDIYAVSMIRFNKNIAGNPKKAAPLMVMLHIEHSVPTDRPSDLLTDIVTYRAAEVQLKTPNIREN